MANRRKIGEKQRVRQPLKIDKLPSEFHRRIQQKKVQGWTWLEIESDSVTWRDLWKTVDEKTQSLFPGLRLTDASLARWYDLRVQQVRAEVMAKAQRAREFAEAFASRGFKDLPEAVRAALADTIFGLMEDPNEKQSTELRYNLIELGKLLAKERKLDIDEKKVEIEQKKLEAVKTKLEKATNEAAEKLGKGRQLTKADIDRIRERTFGLPPVA